MRYRLGDGAAPFDFASSYDTNPNYGTEATDYGEPAPAPPLTDFSKTPYETPGISTPQFSVKPLVDAVFKNAKSDVRQTYDAVTGRPVTHTQSGASKLAIPILAGLALFVLSRSKGRR